MRGGRTRTRMNEYKRLKLSHEKTISISMEFSCRGWRNMENIFCWLITTFFPFSRTEARATKRIYWSMKIGMLAEIWWNMTCRLSELLRFTNSFSFFGVSCVRLWNFNSHCRHEIFHRVSRISHQIHPHWISNSIFHLAIKIPFKRQDISSSLHTAPSEQDKASILTNDKR